MPSVTVDGDTFSVGDSMYVRMKNSLNVDEFAEEEVCQVCGQAEPEKVPRLECDRCLQGYHLTCLDPPLTEVPKVCTADRHPECLCIPAGSCLLIAVYGLCITGWTSIDSFATSAVYAYMYAAMRCSSCI